MGFFLEGLVTEAEVSDRGKVDYDRLDLNVIQIIGLCDLFEVSIFTEDTASFEIVAGTKTAFDVDIGIGSTMSLGELF